MTKISAQVQLPQYNWETGTIGQFGDQKPFWLFSNRDGKFSPEKSAGYTDLFIYSEKDTTTNFNVTYGLEGFTSYIGTGNFQLNQYYTRVQFHFVQLYAGAVSESFGNHYTPLSSGSLLYSRNARPIPKIAISSDGYLDVPFTQGYMKIKGYLSHGWMGEDRYVETPFLHHKYGYAKLGGDLPVNVSYGLQHFAIWGGVSPEHGQLPTGLDSYKKVFFAQTADSTAPSNEALNTLGDHRGSHQFGIEYKNDKWHVNTYYQNIFEDNSGVRFKNFPDGLWGIAFHNQEKKKLIQDLVYELVHTKDQGGKRLVPAGSGNDNFFNNSIYRSGWTNERYTIGTPLITSPILNENDARSILNSRVIAHHVGISGWIKDNWSFMGLVTYSLNYGTHANAFNPAKEQFSMLLKTVYELEKWEGVSIKGSVGLDLGEVYGDNVGVEVSVVKVGGF
jgi:hypothetical protein